MPIFGGGKPQYRCSFCEKRQEDVRRLIAGPDHGSGGVYICDECVELCREIVHEDDEIKVNSHRVSFDVGESIGQESGARIENRKADNIRICLEEDVQGRGITSGFERYRFVHQALPEINLSDVDTSLELWGRRLKVPLLISSMTGGAPRAQEINRNLAVAAQELGIAMGVGSQRAALRDPHLAPTYQVDRKSTRLNSSHANISYAVFCLQKQPRSRPHGSRP